MESHFHISLHARRLPAAWLLLAVTALAISTLCAILLVAARVPLPGGFGGSGELFGRALVLHVSLAIVVWFLACAAAIWALAAPAVAGPGRWSAFGLAATGLAAMVGTLFSGSATPVLANYIPVLDHPLFLSGLILFAAGIALHAAGCARGAMRGLAHGPVWRLGACLSMLAAAMALGALVASLLQVGAPSDARGFEVLAWGPGHVLQFLNVLLLMSVWTVLAQAALKREIAPRRWLVALFALAALPLLAVPVIYFSHPVDDFAFRRAFTMLMAWTCWPAAAMLGILVAHRVLRSGPDARAQGLPLLLSILLFLLGCVLGALIRNDSTMVPAHYHGTVGAITLALMALGYRLLPVFGFAVRVGRLARWQPIVYGAGLVVLALALAWSGWLGVPRKTPHVNVLIQYPAYLAAMGMAGIGGLLAVTGAAMFVANVARALTAAWPPLQMFSSRRHVRPARRDVRRSALALTLGLTMAIGLLIHYWPSGMHTVAVENSRPGQLTPRAVPMRDQEVHRRFVAAAELLAHRKYDAAAAELDLLLAVAPKMPEAHVNMGFAMMGLKRYALARDFFTVAIDLRTTQMNAYFGLAIALEALDDLPGALGAMRTYVHRSPESDPFVRKAHGAIWEWEEKLAAAKAAGNKQRVVAAAIPEVGKSRIGLPNTGKALD